MTLISFIGTLILILIDYKMNNNYELLIDEEEKPLNIEENNHSNTWRTDLKNLGQLFWLVTAVSVFLYASILCFVSISVAYFIELYFIGVPLTKAQNRAGIYISIPYLMGAIGIPILGI